MRVIPTLLPGVLLLEPAVFRDARGTFMEAFSARNYEEAGVVGPFVQDNVSESFYGVLRGMHYQSAPYAQGKLVSVLRGAVFDVAVDVRVGSPTFARWVGVDLTQENRRQLWVPPGFAHGFFVMSVEALVVYKCTAYYRPQSESTFRWDDPRVSITWPAEVAPILSDKDAAAPTLDAVAPFSLPAYAAPVESP